MLETVDLNCDVGEVSIELDGQLLPLVSSCNVSCGTHAGDLDLIAGTLEEAIRQGVAVGAHPSYPDGENFGRTSMVLPPAQVVESVHRQVEWLGKLTASLGGTLSHVKPHGALYTDMVRNRSLATSIVELVRNHFPNLLFYGQADTHLAEICDQNRVGFVHEVFSDRRYDNQQTLRPRARADAVIISEDDFLAQLSTLHRGHVVDTNGQRHKLTVQTICLHGDTPGAIRFAQLANSYFQQQNVHVAAP